jgi:hypothetical protein
LRLLVKGQHGKVAHPFAGVDEPGRMSVRGQGQVELETDGAVIMLMPGGSLAGRSGAMVGSGDGVFEIVLEFMESLRGACRPKDKQQGQENRNETSHEMDYDSFPEQMQVGCE